MYIPAIGTESIRGVVGEADRSRTIDGDLVVVVDEHDAAQAEVAGQRCGLVADALLDIAVGADAVDVVVADVGAQASTNVGFGDRHANSVRNTGA